MSGFATLRRSVIHKTLLRSVARAFTLDRIVNDGGGQPSGVVPMKILIGSVISITPFSPGMAWNWMHHAVGFQKLGHEVYYLEEVEPRWCVDSQGQPCRLA